MESSAEDILLVENSRSLSFLAAFWAFLRFFWLGLSPHRLVPPYILGILRSAIPSNLGPLAKSKAYPSHWTNRINLFIHWRKTPRTIWVTLITGTSATIQNCIKTSWFFFFKKAKHPAYNIFFKGIHWILLIIFYWRMMWLFIWLNLNALCHIGWNWPNGSGWLLLHYYLILMASLDNMNPASR